MAKRKPSPDSSHRILWLLSAALMVMTGILIFLCITMPARSPQVGVPQSTRPAPSDSRDPVEDPSESTTETTLPKPETVAYTATIGAQGDMLMHGGLFNDNSVTKQSDGTWDFTPTFQYIAPYTRSYDYMAANLETTFGGDDFAYRGWPLFNCPDPLADAMAAAGYDLLLTANNHCYDTNMPGLLRTQEVILDAGMDVLGTRQTEDGLRYQVKQINGIPIGMVCYSYTTSMRQGKPMLNGNAPVENPALVNYFAYNDLNGFYAQVDQILADMEEDGAKAVVFFIHWGVEYEIQENATQNQIAQALCDRGVDVIVGGHPHVVQPIELLTSTRDPEQKTVCIYSLGNAVSNQRIEEMNLKTGHTEDGVLFTMTFEQYTDGTVYLAGIQVLPTWVNLHRKNGGNEYNILPLEDARRDRWQEDYSLTEEELGECEKSWQRTMDIVGSGLEEVNRWLSQQKQARDEAYLRQARQAA